MASSADNENRIFKFISSIHPTLQCSLQAAYKMGSSLMQKYEKMVIEDPEMIGKIESTLNLASFLLPGHFKSSELLSELLYFATKMLSLLHDIIYRKKFAVLQDLFWNKKNHLEAVLTVVEYIEAFIELGAIKLWGEVGKWVIIFSLQILKAFLKIVLLYYFDSGIQSSPSLMLIRDRFPHNKDMEQQCGDENEAAAKMEQDNELDSAWKEAKEDQKAVSKDVWVGRRSGRLVRSLKSSPPKGFRDWKLPNREETGESKVSEVDYYKLKSRLSHTERAAELAHILRPIAHLTSMFVFGEKSWKPWLLSLAIDVSSIQHLSSKKGLYKMEKDELLKRKIMLMMYLLRSPFYDRHSKAKLVAFLTLLGDKVPVIGVICKPLLQYLPLWQSMYSHIWSN
eukprot:gene11294-12475_t